jgi:shikimate kinase
MRILLVGVSCVGKSTVGKLLAEKWNYCFVDFDFEVESRMGDSIERIKNTCFNEYEYRNRVKHILSAILAEIRDDVVIAMPPSGLFHEYKSIIDRHPDILTIALKDKAKNIVARLVFYDEDTVLMEDYVVDERNYGYYYNDVKADIEYYYATHRKAKLQFHINGMNAKDATDKLAKAIQNYISSGGIVSEKKAAPAADNISKKQRRNKMASGKHVISEAFYNRYTILATWDRWDTVRAGEDGAMTLVEIGERDDDEYSSFTILDEVLQDFIWDFATWEECLEKMVELDKELRGI